MIPLFAHPPLAGGRRRGAAIALCAAALVVIAGCSAGTAGPPKPLTARAAISLAADQTQRVNSASATFSTSLAGAVSGTMATGTIQIQVRPSLLIGAHVTVSSGGQSIPLDEIVTTRAIYIGSSTLSALAGRSGKPWVELPFADLSGNLGNTLQNLLQTAQNSNPMTQTKLLTASNNARVVGTQVIGGVRTTHYAGTFAPSAALSTLPASLRKDLAPFLKLITGDIHFDAWIDAGHVTRKLVETETVNGETVTQVIRVLAVNQPVHVTVPPASQVIIPPKGKLRS